MTMKRTERPTPDAEPLKPERIQPRLKADEAHEDPAPAGRRREPARRRSEPAAVRSPARRRPTPRRRSEPGGDAG